MIPVASKLKALGGREPMMMNLTFTRCWHPALRTAIAVALVLTTGVAECVAATYYVDIKHPQASDANPGTEALPWKTLYKAAQVLAAGDTVLVKEGIYDVSTGGAWYRPAINPARSGRSDAPITFKAYPGHTVTLDGKNVLANPPIGSYMRDYIVIDGFTIVNPGDKGIVVSGDGTRVKGVLIQNNTVSGAWRSDQDNTDGIRIEDASGTVVRNNRIHNIQNGAGTHNAAGIKLYQADHTLVENNEIYNVVAGIYDKQQGESNTYRRNLIHDCRHVGIEIGWSGTGPDARDNQIYENIIYKCAVGAAVAGQSGGLVYNTSIYNNVIADYTDSGLYLPGLNMSYPSNTRFWNNIFHRTAASNRGDFFTYDDPPSIGLSNYNLFATTPRILIGVYSTNKTYTTLTSWQTAYGWDKNSLVMSPLFLDAANRDYRLAVSSPALGAGRVGGVSTGATVNLGAYPTGKEVIGIVKGDITPPGAPTGIQIVTTTALSTPALARSLNLAAGVPPQQR
jgi:hypothetical protein